MAWHLVQTKFRNEQRALGNLKDQGFECWLPRLRAERVVARRLTVVEEPLFPRYLFIQLADGVNWSPIRSTPGVVSLVRFGGVPARVPAEVVGALQAEEVIRMQCQPARLRFEAGQPVRILEGPFSGVLAVFDMNDGDARAHVLIELLSRPARLTVDVSALRPLRDEEVEQLPPPSARGQPVKGAARCVADA